MGALLFLPIPAVQGSVIYAFLSYIATAMIYSLVNIPYGSLSSSLTRDVVEISKLTATRMFMACSAYFLVNTFFPLFVQLLSPLAEIKDIGMFGIQLPLGNYMTPAAAPADSVLNFL